MIIFVSSQVIPKTIFHYTSFEKFKYILQYGTWRFKLSTQSNDLLDTTYIVDTIKKLEIQCKNIATNWKPTTNKLWKTSHGCE